MTTGQNLCCTTLKSAHMNDLPRDLTAQPLEKFSDPLLTATGEPRAVVPLIKPETLWFNTGTLCNIACTNCFMESSPENDRLAYISAAEVRDYLEQIKTNNWPVREIGFTGGEPFMNPDMIEMTRTSLIISTPPITTKSAAQAVTRKP